MKITPLDCWIAAKCGHEGRPLDPEALRSYQLARLTETLERVQRHSLFYRRALGTQTIRLAALEELADLPFSTAEELREAPFDFLCVRPDEVDRIVTLITSGTTGPPKRIFFTADDQELTRDFFHVGMSTLVDPGDRVLILLPGHRPGSVGDLLADGLARMDVRGIPHGPVGDLEHTLRVMEEEAVTALVGIPVQVLGLARLAARGAAARGGGPPARPCADSAGIESVDSVGGGPPAPPRSPGLKSALLSTDRVSPAAAAVIEDTWGCTVFNHYGTTEMGLGGGVDCRARAGYHLREADLFFEIVDPVTGQVLPEGETGEVVFTTLTRQAMPLIRYRTGDFSRFIPDPCPCGTRLRRLAHVHQRVAGSAALRNGGRLTQEDLDEALFPLDGLVDFRTTMSMGSDRDELAIEVIRLEGAKGPSNNEVGRALLSIPALSAEIAAGTVHLRVGDWEGGDGDISGVGKRRIVFL